MLREGRGSFRQSLEGRALGAAGLEVVELFDGTGESVGEGGVVTI
jgi:hypothetical protein